MTQNKTLIALGANIGDRLAALRAAIDGLKNLGRVDALSRVYETAPMYVADQPAFLNMALVGEFEGEPPALLDRVKALEVEIGRVPSFRNGPRAIDIDLLSMGDITLDTDRLTLPHPRIAERAFVLAPLADIVGDSTLPGHSKSIATLLEQVEGRETVQVAHNHLPT